MIIFKQPIQNKELVPYDSANVKFWERFEFESISWQYVTFEEFVFLFSKIGDTNSH